MKKFKLIAKLFFEQKCKEIWKALKEIPTILAIIFTMCVFSYIGIGVAFVIGYCFLLFVPDLKEAGEQLYKNCIGLGMVILVLGTFIIVVVYKFINWIKENIELAKERAEEELGLSRYSSTQFPNISSKVKYREK